MHSPEDIPGVEIGRWWASVLGQGREALLVSQVRGGSCQIQRGIDMSHRNVA